MATHTVTPTPRVLILDHSFIQRLQKFTEHHIGYLDLSLQITAPANITWHGIGRRAVAKTIKFDPHVVRSTRPDIVIVQLGTNDQNLRTSIVCCTILTGQNSCVYAKPFVGALLLPLTKT